MKRELINNTNVGVLLAPTVTPLSGGTTNSLWLDRKNFLSGLIALATGVASGTPTTQSVKIKLKTADDISGTNATDLLTNDGNVIELELTADSLVGQIDVDLVGAKAFIGAEIVTAFTGGTTPAIPVNLVAVLGDSEDTREI